MRPPNRATLDTALSNHIESGLCVKAVPEWVTFRQKMFEFIPGRFIFSQFRNVTPAARLVGPSICSIGWIPHCKSLTELPECGLTRHAASASRTSQLALNLMLRSGNPEPLGNWGSREDFLASLAAHEFRGVAALDNVAALLTPDGADHGRDIQLHGRDRKNPSSPRSRQPVDSPVPRGWRWKHLYGGFTGPRDYGRRVAALQDGGSSSISGTTC